MSEGGEGILRYILLPRRERKRQLRSRCNNGDVFSSEGTAACQVLLGARADVDAKEELAGHTPLVLAGRSSGSEYMYSN